MNSSGPEKKPGRISRRDFLKLGLLMIAATSCKPIIQTLTPIAEASRTPTIFPTILPTLTPTSTETPTPAPPMIEVDGLKVPDPKASNPELFDLTKPDSPIVQFANAFGVKPEEVGNLTPQLLTGVDKKQFVVMTTGDLAATTNFDEFGIPLLIAQQEENGEWGWSEVSLKNLAEKAEIKIGSAFDWGIFSDNQLYKIFFNELNSTTIDTGIYWNEVEPNRNKFDFSVLDKHAEESQKYGFTLRGHALIFPTASWSIPDWLKNGNFSEEELTQILINHIKQVVSHGKQQGINEWVVVNEPYLSEYREDDMFYKIFGGYDYIEIAFQAAREADPSAVLIYNDTDNHDSHGLTTSLTRQIIERLQSKDLVDAVGVQAHLGDWVGIPDSNDVINTLKSYGLPVKVTEFDYNLKGVSGSQQERYLKQAEVYEKFFLAALKAGVIDFNFWGISDNNSWLKIALGQIDADPTIFDRNLSPKPAYFAVTKALVANLLNRSAK